MYNSKPAGARDFRLGLFESPHRGVKIKPGLEKLVLAFSHFPPQKSRQLVCKGREDALFSPPLLYIAFSNGIIPGD